MSVDVKLPVPLDFPKPSQESSLQTERRLATSDLRLSSPRQAVLSGHGAKRRRDPQETQAEDSSATTRSATKRPRKEVNAKVPMSREAALRQIADPASCFWSPTVFGDPR
ncbi:hypothetical protein WJX73_004972 [Symbiochloris irregularis]|uniref:Uncharacterized protein n=1 Tax=Symbiochloris irregularis TaxID=706552 RepID=A0AAW1PXK7_9CHLO